MLSVHLPFSLSPTRPPHYSFVVLAFLFKGLEHAFNESVNYLSKWNEEKPGRVDHLSMLPQVSRGGRGTVGVVLSIGGSPPSVEAVTTQLTVKVDLTKMD